MLGYSLHAAGRLDEAMAAHEKAATFPATKAAATYNIACVHALKGEIDAAFGSLDKAVAAGFQDLDLARKDSDLEKLRSDARFAKFLDGLKGAQKAPQLQVYQQSIERRNARVAWFAGSGGAGQVAIDYSPVPWQDAYDAQVASGKLAGQKWRLGADFWTRLDTSVDLRFGKVAVPAGYYYLTLEQRAGGQYVLALHDPAAVRQQKLDAFEAAKLVGGIEIPMTYAKADAVAKELAIAVAIQGGSKSDGTLSITFGGHHLAVPFTADLKPPATK